MKHTLSAILLIVAFAGCTEPNTVDDVETAPVAPAQSTTLADLRLTVADEEVVLQGTDTTTIRGTASEGALVSYTYDRDLGGLAAVDNGTWQATISVPFGHTDVEIFADNGSETTSQNVTIKRNMQLTVTIDHDPAQGKADRSDTFYWDHGSIRSLRDDSSYDGCSQPHPGQPNAHDALLDYSDATGVPITYTPCGSFGVSVDVVDDVDYGPLGWCFEVNGEQAELGISLLELADGDVFSFVNCSGFGG